MIRDEQGLAYSIFSFFDANLLRRVRSRWRWEPTRRTREKAVTGLEQQIARIRDEGVTQREVDEAVAYLTGRFPLPLETNEGLAEILWVAEFYHLGPDYIDRYTRLLPRGDAGPGERGGEEASQPGPRHPGYRGDNPGREVAV